MANQKKHSVYSHYLDIMFLGSAFFSFERHLQSFAEASLSAWLGLVLVRHYFDYLERRRIEREALCKEVLET